MKNFLMFTLFAALFALVSACAPVATEADCKAACDKKAGFEVPAADPAALDALNKAVADATAALTPVEEQRNKLAEAVLAEKATKIGAAQSDDEKAKIEAEYAPKIAEAAKDVQAQFEQLAAAKAAAEQAVAAAQQKATDDDKKRGDASAQCTTSCVEAKTKKSTTDCQVNAANIDELSACK